MRYIKYLFIAMVLVFSYSSKSYHTHKQIPPYYQLEVQGLNKRITNELSDFSSSPYIEKQIARFNRQWGLKGASLAVVKDDKLVYAQGFGFANDQNDVVQPGNLFRVASVSKLLTGVAIMKLVEEKKLNLDQQVFGPTGIIKDTIFNKVRDKRLYKITVRQLLAHSGGWSQRYGDPAFNSLTIAEKVGDQAPATIHSYYKYIATRRLSFYPGTQTSYSNMGYMFLGEIIATVSGKTYESFIQDNILVPNGIVDMHIANSYAANRFENEVSYYESEGSALVPEYNGSGKMVAKSNGGNPIELLGAAGGWTCSAIELARLVTYIDGEPGVKDILKASSIAEMTDNTYAKGPLGWKTSFNNGTWIRTGSMAGTSAMIKRMDDGLTWVFISNTSSWKGSLLANDINSLMYKICYKVKEWPDQDLFNYYPIHTLPLAKAN
ncbi:serine hydrolase domain-containing protein [Mangrovibacterium diazotrophicum]|uniref:CubicO group peptidase (Beta-lactamase class C family) n=1 Tax=Mangrovibacterium diazotrophicum TaxID=1261403 RepID=A0A419W3Q0_9BACT|nr:serine hydrolase domain-containing protein [Mangrovibacterium diazotrophicum]RKD90073.1 CubicO group peptidase (beta-lactamase class C family) [Mangrovibacterium diazotrophicum]